MSYKRTKCFHCRKDYKLKKIFGIAKELKIIVYKMEEDISFSKVITENKSDGENYPLEIKQQLSKYNIYSYLKSHGVLKDAKVIVHQLSKKCCSDPENKKFTSDLLGGWKATKNSPNKEQGNKKKVIQCAGSIDDTSLASSCTPGGSVVEASYFDLCSSSCINSVYLDENIRAEKIQRLKESKRQQEEHLEKIRRELKK